MKALVEYIDLEILTEFLNKAVIERKIFITKMQEKVENKHYEDLQAFKNNKSPSSFILLI